MLWHLAKQDLFLTIVFQQTKITKQKLQKSNISINFIFHNEKNNFNVQNNKKPKKRILFLFDLFSPPIIPPTAQTRGFYKIFEKKITKKKNLQKKKKKRKYNKTT